MRKKFVYFILVPALILLPIVYFLADSWVEMGLEYAGERIAGARVDIDHVELTLSPIGVRWKKMQVADARDPWRNLFETGKVQFALNIPQLLRGKYIIETIEVNDFIVGTHRTTDGSVPGSRLVSSGPSFVDMAKASLEKSLVESSPINPDILRTGVNPDSLVKAVDIKSLKRIDSLTLQVVTASQQWDASLSDLGTDKKQLTDIAEHVRAINPSQIKGVDQVLAATRTVDDAAKSVNEIRARFGDRRSSIQSDLAKLSGSVSSLDQAVSQDFQHLLSLAHLPELNTSSIARDLVGHEMYDRALSYLHWIDVARSMIRKYSPPEKDPDPPRMRGQDIHFLVGRAYPDIWIRKILLSGGTDSVGAPDFIRARGVVENITDDQLVTRLPTTVSLDGSRAGRRAMTLNALLDRTKEMPYDEFTAALSGVPLGEFQFGNVNFLPTKVSNARMSSLVRVAVPGNDFDVRANFNFTDIRLTFAAEPKNKIEAIVRDVLGETREIVIGLRMWTTGRGVDAALSTDLDDQILTRVKGVIGVEFTRLQNDLRSKFDARVAEKRKEFDQLLMMKRASVEERLAAYKSIIDQQAAALETKKKELTDQLEKEKKGKINDALKGIIKR